MRTQNAQKLVLQDGLRRSRNVYGNIAPTVLIDLNCYSGVLQGRKEEGSSTGSGAECGKELNEDCIRESWCCRSCSSRDRMRSQAVSRPEREKKSGIV